MFIFSHCLKKRLAGFQGNVEMEAVKCEPLRLACQSRLHNFSLVQGSIIKPHSPLKILNPEQTRNAMDPPPPPSLFAGHNSII
jgi:hypothetical protein